MGEDAFPSIAHCRASVANGSVLTHFWTAPANGIARAAMSNAFDHAYHNTTTNSSTGRNLVFV